MLTVVTEPIFVAKVPVTERDAIRELYVRKIGIAEAFAIMARTEGAQATPLYRQIVEDLGEATVAFQSWWDRTAKAYAWQSIPGKKWRIDFDTCDVWLD
jgi:CXXX repeat modification system protein